MPQPAPRLDDDGLVAEILARVPEAGDERRVRSLLAAWWRYAGVRNAAGAVVDSETFIAERGALGLLELPPTVAARVIALEFALLHDPAAVAESDAAAPPEPPAPVASEPPPLRVIPSLDLSRPVEAPPVAPPPPPAVEEPAPVAEEPVAAEQPVAFEELVPVEEPEPALEEPIVEEPIVEEPVAVAPPVEDVAPPVAEPVEHEQPVERVIELDEVEADEDEEIDLDAEPDPHAFDDDDEAVPISAFEAFQEERYRSREDAQTAVLAGIVVFFSLVVGLALLLGSRVEHLSLPTGADEPLVTGWRAFLAILTGFGGFAIGLVALGRLGDRRGAAAAPTVGLLGLGVLGLGLLSGSVPLAAVGGVVFALGGVVALLRR
jgi:hypothetical protein